MFIKHGPNGALFRKRSVSGNCAIAARKFQLNHRKIRRFHQRECPMALQKQWFVLANTDSQNRVFARGVLQTVKINSPREPGANKTVALAQRGD